MKPKITNVQKAYLEGLKDGHENEINEKKQEQFQIVIAGVKQALTDILYKFLWGLLILIIVFIFIFYCLYLINHAFVIDSAPKICRIGLEGRITEANWEFKDCFAYITSNKTFYRMGHDIDCSCFYFGDYQGIGRGLKSLNFHIN